MEGASGDASPGGLPRPVGLEDMFTDEGWELLNEERRRGVIEKWNERVEYTDESRRIHEELVVGKGTAGFTPHPCLLPDDYEGPVDSAEKPWRIFTDPDAVSQLLDIANEHHAQMERKDREALLQGRDLADAAAKRDGGSIIDEGEAKRPRVAGEGSEKS